MNEIQDYPTRLSDPASRKFETFSYLPELNKEQIRRQIEYLVSKGWHPAIEHTEPENTGLSYWSMWKLPLFGETNVDRILSEAEACYKANPGHYVRLVAYDTHAQCLGTALVIYRGPIEAVA